MAAVVGLALALTLAACADDDDEPTGSSFFQSAGRPPTVLLSSPSETLIYQELPVPVAGECGRALAVDLYVDGVLVEPAASLGEAADCFVVGTRFSTRIDVSIGRHTIEARVINADGTRSAVREFRYEPDFDLIAEFEAPVVEAEEFFDEFRVRQELFIYRSDPSSYDVVLSHSAPPGWLIDYRSPVHATSDATSFSVDAPAGTPGGEYEVIVTATAPDGTTATAVLTVLIPSAGGSSSSVAPSSTNAPQPPVEVSGKWSFVIEVTSVAGSCSIELPYDREVEITQTGETLSVVGLGDPGDAWTGTVDQAERSVSFGGDRLEDDGTTTTSFVLTANDSSSRLDGTETWSWETKPGSGDCFDGVSTVKATRVP